MEPIKTSESVEFDVIYADGTRRHVNEGVLFEVKDEKIIFHNGTSKPVDIIAVAEAAREVVGLMGKSPEAFYTINNIGKDKELRALILKNVYKRLLDNIRRTTSCHTPRK